MELFRPRYHIVTGRQRCSKGLLHVLLGPERYGAEDRALKRDNEICLRFAIVYIDNNHIGADVVVACSGSAGTLLHAVREATIAVV